MGCHSRWTDKLVCKEQSPRSLVAAEMNWYKSWIMDSWTHGLGFGLKSVLDDDLFQLCSLNRSIARSQKLSWRLEGSN